MRPPLEVRRDAIAWYLEGAGFRSIARRLNISPSSVMRWVKALGEDIERLRPQNGGEVSIMELDEMWHFVKKSPTSVGSGLPMTETEKESALFS